MTDYIGSVENRHYPAEAVLEDGRVVPADEVVVSDDLTDAESQAKIDGFDRETMYALMRELDARKNVNV